MYHYGEEQIFVRLTNAENGNDLWVDTNKIVMMEPWLKEGGTITTYIACESKFAVKVKESIEEIFELLKEEE